MNISSVIQLTYATIASSPSSCFCFPLTFRPELQFRNNFSSTHNTNQNTSNNNTNNQQKTIFLMRRVAVIVLYFVLPPKILTLVFVCVIKADEWRQRFEIVQLYYAYMLYDAILCQLIRKEKPLRPVHITSEHMKVYSTTMPLKY
uniref:Uncharacterized protein n=1 Tax=Glossina palpalis gambiensis TaxID=67801 RepID=A0A1B0BTK3_9MUSC